MLVHRNQMCYSTTDQPVTHYVVQELVWDRRMENKDGTTIRHISPQILPANQTNFTAAPVDAVGPISAAMRRGLPGQVAVHHRTNTHTHTAASSISR